MGTNLKYATIGHRGLGFGQVTHIYILGPPPICRKDEVRNLKFCVHNGCRA